MFSSTDFYIDLGTANTLICTSHRGTLLNEPSVVTTCSLMGRTGTYAVGTEAKKMLGKTPSRLTVHRPLRDGVIANFDSTARMLNGFISRIKANCYWFRPKLIISLPYQVTYHERQAVKEIGLDLGAKNVELLHEPVAAAIGANLPIFDKRGSMIVDIGGGTTEIAIISVGGVVNAQAVRTGGNHIDEAIIKLVRNHYQIAIGDQTAEKIKISVASALVDGINYRVEIGGLDCATGLPTRAVIDSRMIYPAVDGVLRVIIASIRQAFSSCPADIAGDIEHSGIMLAGGGALMHQLQDRLEMELGIRIRIAENPLYSVTRGGAWALRSPKLFELLEAPF
ncbi:MAG: rod shape-determining protein [Pseudohongiella sp.]|nr:MAG: rod shape-determining protein [Pseudohongiella sp.]